MAEPFLGEIRPFPFIFAPRGWAFCQGQVLAISQFTALFSILGTTYGGNGTSTFALPDLRGAVPIGAGQGPGLSSYVLGQTGGVENATLLSSQMPPHTHALPASASSASVTTPAAAVVPAEGHGAGRGGSFNVNTYTTQAPGTTLEPGTVTATGSGQPHNNMQPSLVINWCIALQGIFPSRN
jgi:microcystin-dependent protein